MSNITNINDLGTEYVIYADGKKPIKNIKIIWADEILVSTLGEYNEAFYDGYSDYLETAVSRLTNFVDDPYAVTWYCATERDFDLHNAVQKALNENNDIVVVEMIMEERQLYLDSK